MGRHAFNLLRFATVWSLMVFAFTFNAAAYVAWLIYTVNPDTRVHGAPPMNWLR